MPQTVLGFKLSLNVDATWLSFDDKSIRAQVHQATVFIHYPWLSVSYLTLKTGRLMSFCSATLRILIFSISFVSGGEICIFRARTRLWTESFLEHPLAKSKRVLVHRFPVAIYCIQCFFLPAGTVLIFFLILFSWVVKASPKNPQKTKNATQKNLAKKQSHSRR